MREHTMGLRLELTYMRFKNWTRKNPDGTLADAMLAFPKATTIQLAAWSARLAAENRARRANA